MGPNVPKKEDDILFHGARVLKLPESDAVWGSDAASAESNAENDTTPSSSNTQSVKRRKNDTGSKEGSAKRTKKTPSGTSKSTNRDSQGTSSGFSGIPRKLNLGNSSMVKISPKVAATSGKSEKASKESVVINASKRLLERELIAKSNKAEMSSVRSTDDVIYIPEEGNVIEILDEDN